MPDQVAPRIRRLRAQRLREIARQSGESFRRRFLGQVLPVLWENRAADGRWSGLTDNYIRVLTHSEDDLANEVRATQLCDLVPGGVRGRLSLDASRSHP
jgi:threonylcarbamoyladenosine tRNA methylthiotransferase MtaB